MALSDGSKGRFKLVVFLVVGILREILACSDSSQCRFGQQCCKDTHTCKASCLKKHETNIGVVIGIVVAVALGNALFWITFCCLCWCKGKRKSSSRYRSFSGNEDSGQDNNIADVVDDSGNVIGDDHVNDETEATKALAVNDQSISHREEISLSIIKIKRPIIKSEKGRNKLVDNMEENAGL